MDLDFVLSRINPSTSEVLFWVMGLPLLGLFFGSFINVVVDRMYRDESFWKGRSYCDHCKHVLGVKDLIPLFSFIYLKGKCRYCAEKIPKGNFFVEIFSALTFLFFAFYLIYAFPGYLFSSLYSLGGLFSLVFWILFLVILLIIFISDLKYMIISSYHFYALALMYVIGFVLNYFFPYSPLLSSFYGDWLSHFYGALGMFLFFGSLSYFSKERLMGEGDIYLSALFGLFLGLEKTIIMWFLAFFIGAVFGIVLMVAGRKKLASAIPFGPFLIIGFLLSALFSHEIETLYYSLFLMPFLQ